MSGAKKDFAGYFSQLFAANATTAASDATELATRLRDLATAAGDLKASAAAEQKRRTTARAWVKDRKDRNVLVKLWDDATESADDGKPPVGQADPPRHTSTTVTVASRDTPAPGSGSGSGGTSSARPSELRSFAKACTTWNGELADRPAGLSAKLVDFASKCRWGTLDGSGVVAGFKAWNTANDNDVTWANALADAFHKAASDGSVVTLSNSALAAALAAQHVTVNRDDLTIDPAVAVGHPPSTGYAMDPVNTATGNFVETEIDLGFPTATAGLVFPRTYNSVDTSASGGFGPGWSSWAAARLEFTASTARMRHDDGRVSVFPRARHGHSGQEGQEGQDGQGEEWERAVGERLWLSRTTTAAGGFRVRDRDGATWDFTGDGRLARTATGPGTRTTFTYDDQDRLTRITHARGRWLDLAWGREPGWGSDRVTALTASDGRTACYTYDEYGRLVAASGDRGARTYRWNEQGLLTAVVDADGVVEVDNAYDTARRVARQTTRHGRTVRFTYLSGRTTVVSDLDGARSNTWLHDARGRLVGVVDADERRQSMSYDAFGNLVLCTDRAGQTTVHGYDDQGRRIRTVTPAGADLTYGYDTLGRVTTVVTEEGAVSEYSYLGINPRPVTLTDPEGGVTRFTWETGLLTGVTDPAGVHVGFGYDAHGDLTSVTDAEGNTARLERDGVGRVTAAVSPGGARTQYRYDGAGQLVSLQDPNGSRWRYEYTAAGRLAAVVDPYGARTTTVHGPHGEPVASTDPLGSGVPQSGVRQGPWPIG